MPEWLLYLGVFYLGVGVGVYIDSLRLSDVISPGVGSFAFYVLLWPFLFWD